MNNFPNSVAGHPGVTPLQHVMAQTTFKDLVMTHNNFEYEGNPDWKVLSLIALSRDIGAYARVCLPKECSDGLDWDLLLSSNPAFLRSTAVESGDRLAHLNGVPYTDATDADLGYVLWIVGLGAVCEGLEVSQATADLRKENGSDPVKSLIAISALMEHSEQLKNVASGMVKAFTPPSWTVMAWRGMPYVTSRSAWRPTSPRTIPYPCTPVNYLPRNWYKNLAEGYFALPWEVI